MQALYTKAQETITNLNAEIESLRTQLGEQEAAATALQGKIDKLTAKQKKETSALRKQLNNAYTAMRTLATHLSASIMNNATNLQERNELQARLNGIADNANAWQDEREALQKKAEQLTEELTKATADLEAALQNNNQDQVAALNLQINNLTADLAAAQDTINNLLAELGAINGD